MSRLPPVFTSSPLPRFPPASGASQTSGAAKLRAVLALSSGPAAGLPRPRPRPARSRDGAPRPLPPAHVISPRERKPDPVSCAHRRLSAALGSLAERGGHAAPVGRRAPAGPSPPPARVAAAAAAAAGRLPGARGGGSQAQRAAAAHRRPGRGARRHGNSCPRPPRPPLLGHLAMGGWLCVLTTAPL